MLVRAACFPHAKLTDAANRTGIVVLAANVGAGDVVGVGGGCHDCG